MNMISDIDSYSIIADQVIESRAGGKVERCHVLPHLGSYSNAAHSWGVAMLMHYLWPEDFPRLALICLAHDVPERVVGDIPAPPLRHIPGLREGISNLEALTSYSLNLPAEANLSPEDHAKLKACDHLELWIWSQEQVAIGNQYSQECITTLEEMWKDRPLPKEAQRLKEKLEARGFMPERTSVRIQELLA